MVKIRRNLVERYNQGLKDNSQLRLPYESENSYGSYHLYVVRVNGGLRNKLYNFLRKDNILTQVNYIPVHLLSAYKKKFGYKLGDFKIAEQYFEECLSLPLYVDLSKTQQDRIINKIKQFFRQ